MKICETQGPGGSEEQGDRSQPAPPLQLPSVTSVFKVWHGPAASASLRSGLEMQNARANPRPNESQPMF